MKQMMKGFVLYYIKKSIGKQIWGLFVKCFYREVVQRQDNLSIFIQYLMVAVRNRSNHSKTSLREVGDPADHWDPIGIVRVPPGLLEPHEVGFGSTSRGFSRQAVLAPKIHCAYTCAALAAAVPVPAAAELAQPGCAGTAGDRWQSTPPGAGVHSQQQISFR